MRAEPTVLASEEGLEQEFNSLQAQREACEAFIVREDGFEYDGQWYRSLTVIAERITGAHWSEPGSSPPASEPVHPSHQGS